MIRALTVLVVAALVLAARAVADPAVRLDGSVVVPVLLVGAAAIALAVHAERGGAR